MATDLNVCYQSQLFTSDTRNSFLDDSRIEFPSSKRFTRKKESYHDQNRATRSILNDQNQPTCSIEKRNYTEETRKITGFTSTFLKTEDLFMKIAVTPGKNRILTPQMGSDRPQFTVVKQQKGESAGPFVSAFQTCKKSSIEELKAETESKSSEIEKLSCQNMALKQRLHQRQNAYERQKEKIKRQYEITIRQLQGQLVRLTDQLKIKSSELSAKNQEIKIHKKKQQQLIRDVKSSNYDKLILQKKVQQLYKIKLSKQTRDLMSFRQISLMAQVQELKKRLDSSKSQNELNLEGQIRKLRGDVEKGGEQYRNIEIHSRLLQRKVSEFQKELKDRSALFSRSYSKVKQSNVELGEQLKKIRKENIKLNQLFALQGPRGRSIISISAPSTPLSLSPCKSSLSLSSSSSLSSCGS